MDKRRVGRPWENWTYTTYKNMVFKYNKCWSNNDFKNRMVDIVKEINTLIKTRKI